MKIEKLTFKNEEGKALSARIEFPLEDQPIAYALFAHCFTCGKDLIASRNISRTLTSKGIAVMLFDFTGLGDSEGDFESSDFSGNIRDLYAASNFLKENYEAPKILIGHSLGGAAVLFAAAQLASIKAVVTIAAPFDPYHLTKMIAEDLDKIKEKGSAEVAIGGRPFRINQSFINDLKAQNAEEIARELRKPLLILHSPQDEIVNIENAAKIYSAARHPKSFISLDGANHLLSNKQDSEYVGNIIAGWVRRYLNVEEKQKTAIQSNSKVAVLTSDESFTTQIKAGRHHLLADEPEEVGGDDRGPTPYDLLSSALGACTSMTLQLYAKRKKWDLKEVIVHLNHGKEYGKDCLNCEKSGAKIDQFERKIELIGDLDNDQKQRLLEIAEKCPVHKTLHAEISVTTSLME